MSPGELLNPDDARRRRPGPVPVEPTRPASGNAPRGSGQRSEGTGRPAGRGSEGSSGSAGERATRRWSHEVREPPPLAGAALPPRLQAEGGPDGPEPLPLSARAADAAPPWLVSTLVHAMLIVILGIWLTAQRPQRKIDLVFELIEEQGEQIEEQSAAVEVEQPTAEELEVSPSDEPEVDDPTAAPPEPEPVPEATVPADETRQEAPDVGLALTGREEGRRLALVEKFGGTGQSEEAVLRGLKWLARVQKDDGSWSLRGNYPQGGGFENAAAATAMALLAFQGAGHTHQRGSFRDAVAGGLAFLLSQQDASGSFFRSGQGNSWFYTHAQCTIAVCELAAMSGDQQLREPARRALDFCIESQGFEGGWRYSPRNDSDTSVTGWVLMALESGRMGGFEIPRETFYRVGEWLDRVSHDGGAQYAYVPGAAPTPSMTAEGLLCRQYLGWGQYDPRLERGAQFLARDENLPSYRDRDVYYWYYATQVLHHLQGPEWPIWNERVRDLLVEKQEKTGKNAGSWHPLRPSPDRWGSQGGRLYVTCLSLYVLEVYYRHLPLYQSRELAGR